MATTCIYELERLRKRAGVSLETISERTKICTRYLRAIESEEFEKLPGGVFSTSWIRQYALAIGFDEKELLALYAQRNEERILEREPEVRQVNRTLLRTCVEWLLKPVLARQV